MIEDDTKHCRIAVFMDEKKLYESSKLKKLHPRAIICPYKTKNQALVVFQTCEGKIHGKLVHTSKGICLYAFNLEVINTEYFVICLIF